MNGRGKKRISKSKKPGFSRELIDKCQDDSPDKDQQSLGGDIMLTSSPNKRKNSQQFKYKNVLEQIWREVKKTKIIRQFIENLKSLACYRDKSKLNEYHFGLISDKSRPDVRVQYSQSANQPRPQPSVFGFFRRSLRQIKVISPDWIQIIVWKQLLFLFCFIELYKLPIIASFGLSFQDGVELWFLYITPLILFSLEVLINFNTGYYQEGNIVKDRRSIFRHYLSNNFWIDLLNALTTLFVHQLPAEVLYLSFFIRIAQLQGAYSIIDEHHQFTQRYPTPWNLLKLITQVFFVAHFMGCGFHTIARYQQAYSDSSVTWLDDQQISTE